MRQLFGRPARSLPMQGGSKPGEPATMICLALVLAMAVLAIQIVNSL